MTSAIQVSMDVGMVMALSELKVGEKGSILCCELKRASQERFIEMGFIPGEEVELIQCAPFGGPIALKIMNYQIIIRKNDARQITIKKHP